MPTKADQLDHHVLSDEPPPSYEQSNTDRQQGAGPVAEEARADTRANTSNVDTAGYQPQEGMKWWEDPERWRETEDLPGCLCSDSGGFFMSSHGGVCCSDHGGVICSDSGGVMCSDRGGVCFSTEGGVCCADGREGGPCQ